MSRSIDYWREGEHLLSLNSSLINDLYRQYLNDASSVSNEWQHYFSSLGAQAALELKRIESDRPFHRGSVNGQSMSGAGQQGAEKQVAVTQLIQAYRRHGHRLADLDPLGMDDRQNVDDLELSFYGLTEADLDQTFVCDGFAGKQTARLRWIVEELNALYCHTLGIEFAHLASTRERLWLQQQFEAGALRQPLAYDERQELLQHLTAAEGIERYLHTRYVGQKRFSLEGGESLIPLLIDFIRQAGAHDVEEVVIGMAHRGRLNVLINVLGKPPSELFSEFEGRFDDQIERRSGDVKYHLGFSSDMETAGGPVHVALAFNPSHLEIVNPVVEGSVRARQERRKDRVGKSVVPVLIHGDAAFAGQGVVMETLQMSGTRGFSTGGSLHIICNNQVGFTTSNPADARSTPYTSDVAKMIEAPVIHVNADDPEAVIFASRLAQGYRAEFGKDFVIDLVCYRRHGHNEADEPAATQPKMYQVIRAKPSAREAYAELLTKEGVVEKEYAEALIDAYRGTLDAGRAVTLLKKSSTSPNLPINWEEFENHEWDVPLDTGLDANQLEAMAHAITKLPENIQLHSRVKKVMAERVLMARGEQAMDWGFAETMAYASLLDDGYSVRITGQDSGRGTFFHRHAVLHDQDTGRSYTPLAHVSKHAWRGFTIYDSYLSEEAVLGFEYGYSTTDPKSLVVWEAQFGDFCNGAQVVIDQFISSGEAKWGRLCGLVMFLPHGYEGQGPEHSSARLERFLQLCAEWNIQVCVPSTPAQMFHMLRRQMMRPIRRPLVVMTPKSLLRHKQSVSDLSSLVQGQFQPIIVDEAEQVDIEQIIFCSGKVYYDLKKAQQDTGQTSSLLVRIEQLYPFPVKGYGDLLRRYAGVKDIVWCQEEPQNQGAWYQIRHRLQEALLPGQNLRYAGRQGAAAPACGYYPMHVAQQERLVKQAFDASQAQPFSAA